MENKNSDTKKYDENYYIEEFNPGGFSMKYNITDVLYSKKSPFQKVEVVQSVGHGRMLLNDGLVMISERDEYVYHEMIAHVPLFIHPNPRRVLIIGGGDGGTAREVLRHSGVEHCDMVEIDELVVEACREFIPQTAIGMSESPRFQLHIADGVEFVKNKAQSQENLYDVIIVDSTDPIGPAQPLFGVEFYKNVFQNLNENGIVVSQAESVFYYDEIQKKIAEILSGLFPKLRFYNFSNLTYPGGLWSFSFASKGLDPLADFDPNRVQASGIKTKYYNEFIHRACFQLPEFQSQMLRPYTK